jgi:hypothetical protein
MKRIFKLALLSGMTLFSFSALAQDPNAPAAAPATTPAAPAAAATPPPAEAPKSKKGGPSLSLSPETPQVGGLVVAPAEVAPVVEEAPTSEWKFDVTGYFRAPLRMSWGPAHEPDTRANMATGTTVDPGTQLRTPPLVPDANYVDWRYTNSLVGPWTELNFHYGNDRVKATVQIASYNLTDPGYRRLEANLGINQAFITMQYPEIGSENLHLTLIVGGFTNRYGAAGRYDGGKYETYLFGRTHVAGETANLSYDMDDFTFQIEEGFGGKLEPIPFYGAPGATGANANLPAWEPYPGPLAQEPTFVAHGHLGASYKKQVLVGLHFIDVFANGNELSTAYEAMPFYSGLLPGSNTAAGGRSSADSKPQLLIWGGDIKWLTALFGDGYLGYSHVSATNAIYLADAIELLHSFGGWQLHDNFFGNPGGTQPVTGTIDSIEFQEVLDLGQVLRYPQAFWGDGPDLLLSIFGMFNHVNAPMNPGYSINKGKAGVELTYIPLPWLGTGFRYDLVRPDLNDANITDPFRAPFSVFSPRIILRTAFVTHEQIMFQYSRYFYANTIAASIFPYNGQPGGVGPSAGADKNAFTMAAIIWF